MLRGGLVFDTSAILVTNIPYIVLMLFPIHYKELLLSVINGLNETEIGFDIIASVDQSLIDNQVDFEDYDLIYDKLNRIF
jgi:hypothetical protein